MVHIVQPPVLLYFNFPRSTGLLLLANQLQVECLFCSKVVAHFSHLSCHAAAVHIACDPFSQHVHVSPCGCTMSWQCMLMTSHDYT